MTRHLTIAPALALLLPLVLALGCATSNNTAPEKPMSQPVRTSLMFIGQAEEAMTFYTSLFDDSGIISITRHGPNAPAPEGEIQMAVFSLRGSEYICTDSPPVHDFTFTPSMSIFVTCESEGELDRLADALSDGGMFMMPPDDYGFSRKFAFLQDRFGVSWQLNLPNESE